MSVTRVSNKLFHLGEGPHWHGHRLYFVDVYAGDVCRLDPATGDTESIHLGSRISFVIPYSSDSSNLIISSKNQIKKLDFNTGRTDLLTEVEHEDPDYCFNDGKCDAKGRLWTGTMLQGKIGTFHRKGHLFKMENDFKLKDIDDGISISNGLAWNSRNDTFYYIDSDVRIIYAYDYDLQDGRASNKRVLIDYNKDLDYSELGLPDGMTVDTEDKLWVANYGGGCVTRIDPETKSILRRFDVPSKHVTSCCFGGHNWDILYVTTGLRDAEGEYPDSGAIFAITGHGCSGLPPNNFKDE